MSVYKEVVEDCIKAHFPDAYVAKKYLEEYKIPVIPIDVTKDLPYFRDPGETSCFILAKRNGICITSDNLARKKMKQMGVESIQLDEYFFNLGLEKKITINEFESILLKLEHVYATNASRSTIFLTELKRSLKENE